MSLILRWRDRLVADPRFQRWAVRFPLTRPIARREARALFDICAGFVYAQTLGACVELDLFRRLAAGPKPLVTLAAEVNVPEPALRMLTGAAQSLRLLRLKGDQVGLGQLGAAMLGNPGVAAMVAHHRLFYRDIADPVALLRGRVETELSKFWPYRGAVGERAGYSDLMAATQPMIAAEILAAYDTSKHQAVLDIGGGDGSFLIALSADVPKARLLLFDLPEVAARATARFATAGLSARAKAFGGDFTQDGLPKGADLITLVRVLHDHDDAKAMVLLRAARAALPSGGALLLAEPMAEAAGAAPIGAAYFGFYLLAMGTGRARRPSEIRLMLIEAGFSEVREVQTRQPMLTGVMVARA